MIVMYFSKIRKSLPVAAILAVLLLGGAATDAAAFSVDVDSLYYNDASGHNLEYFSEITGYVVGNVLKEGVSLNSYTDYITYDWGVPPLSAGDLTLFLDKSYEIKKYPFVRLSTDLRGRAVLSWSESDAPGQAPAVNLDNHIQLYTVKLSNFADLSQGGDSAVIIGLGRDDVPSSYQAAVRITWMNGELAGTYDLILQAVVKNDQGAFWSSDPTLTTHPGLVLSDLAATTMTVTLSVDSPNNFSAAVWIDSPSFNSGDQPDTFQCPAPVPGQISRFPDFLSFVDLETANAGTIQLSASSYSVSENYGSVTITATRRGGSKGQAGVSYATSDGTATAGSDFTAASGTLSWADGDTANKIFMVPILNNGDLSAETFTVTLSDPTGGALGTPASAPVTIFTPAVQFQSGSSSGDKATTPALFTVILPAPLLETVTVDYATADVTATAGLDYTSTSGTLTFAPGQTSQTIAVPIINDPAVEGPQTFTVTLSNPSNATLGTQTIHTYTITEPTVPTVQFQSGLSAGPETETPAVFIVTLSAPSAQPVTVNYATADGTAKDGVGESGAGIPDYTATIGTLTFTPGTPGQTSQTIAVPIINDSIDEESETFTVTLSSPSAGLALGTPAIKTVTIIDDDPTVQFQSGSSSGNETTTPAVFTVTLSAPSTLTATVTYATVDGTATAGLDYTATSGRLDFFPGQTSLTITVPILYNPAVEGSETFAVTLLAASIATLGTPMIHTYTITEQAYTLGDVDGNGAINVFDVIKVARASLGLNNTGAFIAAAADIDKNGTINVFDVIKAARLSLGLSI